jgi:membrane-associated protease RseP (regulator of RpoE activity)
MRLEGGLSYGQEWLVALGGPLGNALTGGLALLGWRVGGSDPQSALFLFGAASLILCGVNLLPVGTLDGGRMLACGLALCTGERVSSAALKVTTALCLGGVWLVAVYALLRAESLLSLFVFSLCLLTRSMGADGASP